MKELDLILYEKYDVKYLEEKKQKYFNYIDSLNSVRVLEDILK